MEVNLRFVNSCIYTYLCNLSQIVQATQFNRMLLLKLVVNTLSQRTFCLTFMKKIYCWVTVEIVVWLYILLWDCTHCCVTGHIVVWLYTLLCDCTYCYETTNCFVTVHIVVWLYTLLCDCTHCCVTVHIVVWLYTLLCDCTHTNIETAIGITVRGYTCKFWALVFNSEQLKGTFWHSVATSLLLLSVVNKNITKVTNSKGKIRVWKPLYLKNLRVDRTLRNDEHDSSGFLKAVHPLY
jgi:hypothetical protein